VLGQIAWDSPTGETPKPFRHWFTHYKTHRADIDGVRRLADVWHRRVMANDVVAHTFSDAFYSQHVGRLAAYWAEALGGPTMYSDSYGDETTVVKMHSGNGEHGEMDRRAIACFDQALADVGLANDGALRQVLDDYFAWATTTTMSRYHRSADAVPNGLSIPHWSWDGIGEGLRRDLKGQR
jgi:hemoglobin